MNLRTYLSELQAQNSLIHIYDKVDLNLEVTTYLEKHKNQPILFHNLVNSDFPLVGNLLPSRHHLHNICGNKGKIHKSFQELIKRRSNPSLVEETPELLREGKVDLFSYPIPKFFPSDGGRYLTSGIVFASFPNNDTMSNASIHRILITTRDKGVIRLVPRNLYQIFKENKKHGDDTPIAIVVGYHPSLALAASTPLPYGESELSIANSLLDNKLKVSKSPEYGITIPSDVEFIFEGRILAEEEELEGPFVDITGTLDQTRAQPVIKFDRVFHKENAIFQTILPSSNEHYLLMGFPREIAIYDSVLKIVPKIKDVVLTPGGCGWLHAVIALKEYKYGDPKNVAFAAFSAHPSLKWCTIVDDDIDIHNPIEVEWATVTRTRKQDIIVIDETRGSSLDPAKNPRNQTSIKVIIDATKNGKGKNNEFNRVTKF